MLISAKGSEEIEVVQWDRADCPATLLQLSLDSGLYSRFKVDRLIPESVFSGVYEGWIKNSINKSMADEVFVAVHKISKEEVGLITVKQRGPDRVDVGLLAVNSSHRRKGISRSLLSTAALWSNKKLEGVADTRLQVTTQGANEAACMA